MTEYHRDKDRMLNECKTCPYLNDTDVCNGIVVVLGADLKESGIMPDADPTKFYFEDPCPIRTHKGWLEEEE